MLEQTTTPCTLDMYRWVTPNDDEVILDNGIARAALDRWNIGLEGALRDSLKLWLAPGEIVYFAHAAPNIEDVEDIDVIDGWVSVEPTRVGNIELIPVRAPLEASIVQLLRDRLEELEPQIEDAEED